MVKTAPPPGAEAASMLPPCSRSTVLQMLSPRPVPRPGRLVVKKGSKMCSRFSGGDSRTIILKHDPYGVGLASDAHANRAFLPVFADGLLRIQQEIQEHLHQLIGIGHDRGDRRFGQKVHRDVALAQRIRLHLHGTLHEFIEIDLAASRSRRAGEVLQVLHDFGGAPCLLVQNGNLFAGGFAGLAIPAAVRPCPECWSADY